MSKFLSKFIYINSCICLVSKIEIKYFMNILTLCVSKHYLPWTYMYEQSSYIYHNNNNSIIF